MVHDPMLAIRGGPPVRQSPFPGRRLFDEAALAAVTEVFEHGWETGRDFGYQGVFEEAYTQDFCRFQGGGFADAVCTGTASLLVALAALEMPSGSHVVCSPVTDPGSLGAVLMLGLVPVLADAAPDGFNVDAGTLARAVTPQTRVLLITHTGGIPVDMPPVMALARERGLLVVEDCSQAHGARVGGIPVGNFGHFGAFSTMFSKNHASGGCGGIVFTRDRARYRRARAMADRGKPWGGPVFDEKNPAGFLFPALNLNQDELSCAIGRATLAKLDGTIARRTAIVRRIAAALDPDGALNVLLPPESLRISPFFATVVVDARRIAVSKMDFALAVRAEGIPVNPDYRYVVAEWPWMAGRCGVAPATPHATQFRESSFNLLFHERFTDDDVDDIIAALRKVEKALRV